MGVYVSKGGCILLYLLNIGIIVIIKETVLLADFRHCFDRLSIIRQGQRSVTYESDVQVDHVSITARTQADCCCQTGRRLAKWTLPENRCPRTPSTARAFASCQTQNSSGLGDQSLLSWQASAGSRGRDALAALLSLAPMALPHHLSGLVPVERNAFRGRVEVISSSPEFCRTWILFAAKTVRCLRFNPHLLHLCAFAKA